MKQPERSLPLLRFGRDPLVGPLINSKSPDTGQAARAKVTAHRAAGKGGVSFVEPIERDKSARSGRPTFWTPCAPLEASPLVAAIELRKVALLRRTRREWR